MEEEEEPLEDIFEDDLPHIGPWDEGEDSLNLDREAECLVKDSEREAKGIKEG